MKSIIIRYIILKSMILQYLTQPEQNSNSVTHSAN